MDKWLKDILPDKNPYHNRGKDQMRKKGDRNSSACVLDCLFKTYTNASLSQLKHMDLFAILYPHTSIATIIG